MTQTIHYQINICGGDFTHVRECFRNWKSQTLVYRRNQQMFEGKQDVRPLSAHVFDNGEVAHEALERVCRPAIRMRSLPRYTTASATCGS